MFCAHCFGVAASVRNRKHDCVAFPRTTEALYWPKNKNGLSSCQYQVQESTACRAQAGGAIIQFPVGGARRLPSSMVARARSGRAGVVYQAHLLSLQRVPQKRRQRCSYVGIAPSWYLFHPCRRVRRTEFHELLVDRFDCAASMQRISVVWNTGAP